MSHDYRVIAPGHIHAGQPLEVGAVVPLRERTAERHPTIFARVTVAPVPGRSSRRAATPQSDDTTVGAITQPED